MALPTFGAVFGGFRIFVKNFVIHFYVEKMVRSECLGLVKHIYLIQTIILIRLLWLPAISKICVSIADKYITWLLFDTSGVTSQFSIYVYCTCIIQVQFFHRRLTSQIFTVRNMNKIPLLPNLVN